MKILKFHNLQNGKFFRLGPFYFHFPEVNGNLDSQCGRIEINSDNLR